MKKRILAMLMAASVTFSGTASIGMTFARETTSNELVQGLAVDSNAALADGTVAGTSDTDTANSGRANAVTADYREWKTDISMDIRKEWQLIQESGMTLDEWDAMVEQMRYEGLSDPMTEEALREADPDVKVDKQQDAIAFIGGSKALKMVCNDMEAYRTAYSLAECCGGSARSDLRLWSKLTINQETVYSFQQMEGAQEALGNVLKIVVDADGSVSAVFSSLSKEADQDDALITRAQAEEIVRKQLKAQGSDEVIFPEETQRMEHSPFTIAHDLVLEEQDENISQQLVWIVYSRNDGKGGEEQNREVPFLAHYVSLDGTYLYSLPVAAPGSEEARNGYRKQDVFASMTADTFTGEITNYRGESLTVTVPVMHSEEDGKWYLGDPDRRIAVANYRDAAYEDEHNLTLVSSGNNADWDQEDLCMYYNYIRAWDFYADMGWIGPDGQKTDVIILKGLAFQDGTPFENACSIGKVENWQMFGYCAYSQTGEPLGLVRALDVMAHEYTHTFTSTIMNTNLYENDQGAINEAMSDILGNLVEYLCQATQDTEWKLGENTGNTIRSMTDPNSYSQPAAVWDCYYGPHTSTPNDVNDQGGVHSNSSLLNRIAALLCTEYGMSYEEAVSFWTMTAMGLTPRTDYPQMPALLEWALEKSGNEQYLSALEKLIEEEDLTRTQLPDRIPINQKVVSLALPDTEAFQDENWGMIALQIDTNLLAQIGAAGIKMGYSLWKNPDDRLSALRGMLELSDTLDLDLDLDTWNLIKSLSEGVTELDDEEAAEVLTSILIAAAGKLVSQSMTWEEDGTREMRMVQKDVPTLYMLINVSDGGSKINGAAVLIAGRWIDLGVLGVHLEDIMVVQDQKSADQKSTEEVSAEDALADEALAEEALAEDAAAEEALETLRMLAQGLAESWSDAQMDSLAEDILEDQDSDNSIEEIAQMVLDVAWNLVEITDYLLTDEEERSSEIILTRSANTQYLPQTGLDKVKLFENA